MKMPLGREVGLVSGRIVLDGDPDPQNGAQPPPKFSAHGYRGRTVTRVSYCWALVRKYKRHTFAKSFVVYMGDL